MTDASYGQRLEIRLSDDDLYLLDEQRGDVTRSAWVRRLIRDAAQRDRTSAPSPSAEGHTHRWVGKIGQRKCRVCGEEA